jgi:glycosyltransferase involved in cell wall biosynthesis
VPNPIELLDEAARHAARRQLRQTMPLASDAIVVGFFGKLIPKKNPDLIFDSLQHVAPNLRSRLHLMFVGSGEMQDGLQAQAENAQAQWGVRTSFMGFVNQSQLPPYYLAADVVVLPSRRMGEAWGLVVNEALNAGCSVVMSDAVGCATEFGHLERVQVIPVGDHAALARALTALSARPRDFHWATNHMARYSSAAAAQALNATFVAYLP